MAESKKRRKLSNGSYEAVQMDSSAQEVATQVIKSKDQRRSLFVRSLPASVTNERLAEHFSQHYPLKHATVVVDPKTKISKGFGFVTFTDVEDAQTAATELNDSIIDGRKIKVEVAESRHREIADEGGKSGPNTKATELRAERDRQRADQQPPKLIVRNLPWSIKDADDLSLLFRSYGKVKHAVVPKKNATEQAGFGFVVIRGKKNAERALEGVNGRVVDGRTLAVDWAVDKKTWEELQAGQNETEPPPSTAKDSSKAKKLNGTTKDEDEEEAASSAESLGDSEDFEDGGMDLDYDLDSELDVERGLIEDEKISGSEEDNEESKVHDTSDSTTIFIRNLPFTTEDEDLKAHFASFGAVRYARVVFDHETERSKGTAFVCFFNEDDAKTCVKEAPRPEAPPSGKDKKRRGEAVSHSILQNEATDPSGRYTLQGRILQVSRALSKEDAARHADQASSKREVQDGNKRRLYLLSEGTISPGSRLYEKLGKAELDIREASAKQRQRLIKSNPNLGLSLTRLSVRNMPRSLDSKSLKALAREAVVGFAKDVKRGTRQPLSKEELARGGDAMREAEKKRKEKGVGIVKQTKIVFEGREGGKVKEDTGAGRSRGYGFVEYTSHRSALMGLRWLNGYVVKAGGEKGKRLIVEFAIENAQVVQRRSEREQRIKMSTGPGKNRKPAPRRKEIATEDGKRGRQGQKRKRDEKAAPAAEKKADPKTALEGDDKNKVAKRNRVIAKKRQMRKTRKSGGK